MVFKPVLKIDSPFSSSENCDLTLLNQLIWKGKKMGKWRIELTTRQLKLMNLWFLSCEDMQIPKGNCENCEFETECKEIRKILWGNTYGKY